MRRCHIPHSPSNEKDLVVLPVIQFSPATLTLVSHAEMQKGSEHGAELSEAALLTH